MTKRILGLLTEPKDLSGQNVSEMEIELGYLHDALNTRISVAKLEGNVIIDPLVEKALKGLKVYVDPSKLQGASKEEMETRARKISDLNETIRKLNLYQVITK
jgi:hypothetical protein